MKWMFPSLGVRICLAPRLLVLAFSAIVLLGVGLCGARIRGPVAAQGTARASVSAEPLVDDYLVAQVYVPENNALITQSSGSAYGISGYAWDNTNDPQFLPAPLLAAIENYGAATYDVTWSSVPDAIGYTLQEATSRYFESGSVQHTYDVGTNTYTVVSQSPGTYYYRVRAINSLGQMSRWSNIQSVEITSQRFAFAPLPALLAAQTPLTVTQPPTVEIRIQGPGYVLTDAVTAVLFSPYTYWSWSYDWTLPQNAEAPYTISVRPFSASYGYGDWDTITVTLANERWSVYLPMIMRRWPPVPYAPQLDPISNPNGVGNYTVSWSYSGTPDVPSPTSYTLQASPDTTFGSITWQTETSNLSYSFTDQPGGTRCYRVQGRNSYGYGEWSQPQCVAVTWGDYLDDFTTPDNWDICRSDDALIEPDDFWIQYNHDKLYTLLVGRFDFIVVSPMEIAPTAPYTLAARVRVVNEVIGGRTFSPKPGSTFGLIFGGNGGEPCPADRYTAQGTGCLSHYYRLIAVWGVTAPSAFEWQLKRIDYHTPSEGGKGQGVTLIDYTVVSGVDINGWNEWEVEVNGSRIRVYLNGRLLGEVHDSTYVNDPYFGLYIASGDAGDVGYQWEWVEARHLPQ